MEELRREIIWEKERHCEKGNGGEIGREGKTWDTGRK